MKKLIFIVACAFAFCACEKEGDENNDYSSYLLVRDQYFVDDTSITFNVVIIGQQLNIDTLGISIRDNFTGIERREYLGSIQKGGSYQFRINGLTPGNQYYYYIYSRNRYGWSNQTPMYNFTTTNFTQL
ncbi:MAG: fibronectin type III domain-containing protein [Cytophagaceae bacterium]|nr:fibronectin type III domain-containing protein [Cytophagaceae bacterium]